MRNVPVANKVISHMVKRIINHFFGESIGND